MERLHTLEGPRNFDVALLPATPALGSNLDLAEKIFKAFEDTGAKAIVITGYATGTTPGAINPFISRSVENGVPVFVLSNNPADDKGPQRITYGAHQDAVDAGVTILRDVNINSGEEVINAIQDEIDQGKTGQDLADAIVSIYGTPQKEAPQN